MGVLPCRSPLKFHFRGRNWNLKKEPATNTDHSKVFALLFSGSKTSSWISAACEQCGIVPVWFWVCYLDPAPQLSQWPKHYFNQNKELLSPAFSTISGQLTDVFKAMVFTLSEARTAYYIINSECSTWLSTLLPQITARCWEATRK